jgi:tetratricopeptide (TPR) repeat protein
MKIYAEVGGEELLRKCIDMGVEYLELSGWDEERANANDLMAICYTKLGEYQEAIKYLHQAIAEYPHQPLHYIRLSLAYFNVGRYRESKHWLEIAGQLDLDDKTAGINNIKEMKVLFAQMLLRIKYNVDKDLPGAVEAAEALLKEQPSKENEENLHFMMDLLDLYKASESAKDLLEYLENIGKKDLLKIIDELPDQMKEQPWAIATRKRNTKARVWKDNEICYFANFGGKHFEKWSGDSIKNGIGGSETAVIKLSEDWVKQGYKVTVYCDPVKPCEINGVTYLPYYYFNKSDKFSTFIQWRSAFLAPTIKAKKFLVDLHDVVHSVDYSDEIINAVDKIMVKSQYHREFLPNVPDDKIQITGNGIVL